MRLRVCHFLKLCAVQSSEIEPFPETLTRHFCLPPWLALCQTVPWGQPISGAAGEYSAGDFNPVAFPGI